MSRFLASFLAVMAILLGGCGINTSMREKITTTGIFKDNVSAIKKALGELRVGMTKTEVGKAGFDLESKNVQCLQGSQAMPFVLGDVKNTLDLSTPEKLENYAKMIASYEACLFPHIVQRTEKTRWFFSDDGGKTKGTELVFVVIFKDQKLFKTEISQERRKDEIDREKSFGGNVLENLLGAAVSAGRRFR